jgi:hypothetical protein
MRLYMFIQQNIKYNYLITGDTYQKLKSIEI